MINIKVPLYSLLMFAKQAYFKLRGLYQNSCTLVFIWRGSDLIKSLNESMKNGVWVSVSDSCCCCVNVVLFVDVLGKDLFILFPLKLFCTASL